MRRVSIQLGTLWGGESLLGLTFAFKVSSQDNTVTHVSVCALDLHSIYPLDLLRNGSDIKKLQLHHTM